MTKFRPADVACLLSASNRRADIVRATPIRSSTESRRAVQKLGGESTYRRDGSGSRKQTRASANVSSKPIARVAPGLRTTCLTLSPRPPDQSGDPASSYRIGAVFLTGR